MDPEYAAWLDNQGAQAEARIAKRRAKADAREARRREGGMRPWGVSDKQPVELLPSSPVIAPEEAPEPTGLSIKGAAAVGPPKRLTLLERLAKAKAETNDKPILIPSTHENPAEINAEDLLDPLQPSISDLSSIPRRSISGLKETVRARLRLRLKLESERANLRHNIAESKAQELRRRLLEAKVIRQAAESDSVLKRMDRLDWQKEIRRRLMVEKMMQAETESERRARELKERLGKEKRRRMLREVLLARKKSLGMEGKDDEGVVA